MQTFYLFKSFLPVFLAVFVNLSNLSEDKNTIFKTTPVNCIVTESSEEKLNGFLVSFNNRKLKNEKYAKSRPYGVIERGMEIPVDDEVNLLMFELQGTKSAYIYNPHKKSEYIILSALTSKKDVGIEGGVEGFMIYWYNYNSNQTSIQNHLVKPNNFKWSYNKKFKGTPVNIIEFREGSAQFEKTIEDPFKIITQKNNFDITISCNLRILDQKVYIDLAEEEEHINFI